jgi:hypothetical protein
MSKEQKPRKRLWAFMGLLAVTGMWGVSAAANGWAGATLSNDTLISFILGAASICCDVMKAVALFVVVAATANRRWVVALTGLLVFALCATWSMRSATYFASNFLTQHVAQRGHDKTLQEQEMASLATKQRRLQWLSGTDIAVDNPGKTQLQMLTQDRSARSSEFKQLSDEIDQQLREMREEKVTANSDPLASVLSLSDATVVLWTAIFFAALLEVVSGVGFWMIAQARVTREPPLVLQFPAERTASGRSPPSSGPPPPATAKPTARRAASAANVVALRPSSPAQFAATVGSVVRDLFEPGTQTGRIPVSQIFRAVNEKLPAGDRLNQGHIHTVLMPALRDLNQKTKRRRKGGIIWIHGVKAKGHTPQLRVAG